VSAKQSAGYNSTGVLQQNLTHCKYKMDITKCYVLTKNDSKVCTLRRIYPLNMYLSTANGSTIIRPKCTKVLSEKDKKHNDNLSLKTDGKQNKTKDSKSLYNEI
jgi:hypothetical protein